MPKSDLSAAQQLEEFSKDARFLEAHREELLKQYEDRWLAVFHGRVIAASEDPEAVLDVLQSKNLVGRALLEYLTRNEPSYLRPA